MAHKEVEDAVEKLLEPILEADGIEVVDVEYVRERNWILRIFIDKEGGVDLNDSHTRREGSDSGQLHAGSFLAGS